MSGAVREAKVRLSVENSQAIRGVKDFGAASQATAGQVERAGRASAMSWEKAGRGARNVALVGVAALAMVEKANVGFDKKMSNVDAATHETTKNMNLLREAAIKAGADTSFSATEAAEGVTELAKAGVSTKAVLGGGLKGALDLAAAGELSVAEAAETAASAMTQFRLKGKDVPHIADLLAAGAGKAQGSVHDLGMALNQAGLVASQAGLSIEETTGTLAAFASAGLVGSDAGTSLKTMLLRLTAPMGAGAKTIKKLGIDVYDAKGQFKDMPAVADELRAKLGRLSNEQRNAAMATIFGSDSIRAANILYRQGGKGIQDWIDKTNDQGYAADTAGRMLDNLAGDVEKVKGALETAFISGGGGFQSGLRDIAQHVERVIDKFNELPKETQENVVKAVAGLTILAGGVYGVSKAMGAVQTLRGGLGKKGALGGAAKGGVVPVYVTNAGFAGPGKGLPGVVTPGKPRSPLIPAGPAPLAASPYLLPLLTKGDSAKGQMTAGLNAKEVKAYRTELEAVKVLYKDLGANRSGSNADSLLARMLGEDPQKAVSILQNAGTLAGQTWDKFLNPKAFPKANSALEEIKKEEASRKGLNQVLLTNAGLRTRETLTLEQYAAGLRKLPPELQTKIKTDGVKPSMQAVRDLVHQYNLTPAQKHTLVKLLGGAAAIREADRVQNRINRMQGKQINIFLNEITTKTTRHSKAPAKGVQGLLSPAMADGGPVVGPGGPRADRVPILASNGEFVVNAAATARNRAWLEQINARKFANGGPITPGSPSSSSALAGIVVPVATAATGYILAAENVAVAEAIAKASTRTAKSVTEVQQKNLEDLRTQQQIKDLQQSLTKTVKVKVGGTKKKPKYATRLELTGIDRTVAQAELAQAKADLGELRSGALALADAQTEAADAARDAIRSARESAVTSLTSTVDIFARGLTPTGAVASVERAVADMAQYGQIVAQLKGSGAAPGLLAQMQDRAGRGDFKSAIRLGQALLSNRAAFAQLNSAFGQLDAVSGSVATMTTDPRWTAPGAWNAAAMAPQVTEARIVLGADPSSWMTELKRVVAHEVQSTLAKVV